MSTTYIPIYIGPLSPEDTDDFQIDFSDKLKGATIVTLAEVVSTPSGLTITNPAIVAGTAGNASAVGFTASAGTPASPGLASVDYTVSASIVTSDGRDLTRSAIIQVRPR